MRIQRLQLIGVLILALLLPALPAALTARSLLGRSLDPLLETEILAGAQAGLESTRLELEREKQRFLETILAGAALDTLSAAQIATLPPREQSALQARGRAGSVQHESPAGVQVWIPPERMVLAGTEQLIASIAPPGGARVWVTQTLDPDLVARAAKLAESVRMLQALRRERGPVIRSLVATFVAVYGGIVVVVLAIGLYMASRLTRPMSLLGAGIAQVAGGDLSTRVPETVGGEAGALLRSFNQMVSRLRTQQAAVIRLEKLAAWRQMARRLAHEIKNPLTPIQLAAQELRDAYQGDQPEYRRFLFEGSRIIEEEVQTLRALVTEFSQFARLPDPQPAWTPLADLLAEVAGLYGSGTVVPAVAIPGGGAGSPVPARLWCDRRQIHRVLINLVNNALAAQAETGCTEPIKMTAEEGGAAGEVRIRVSDRGPGVPPEQRERIFEPDVTTRADGTGLGLAIVEATMLSHGGSVAVAARAGGGAEFVLTFPAAPAVTEESSHEAAQPDC